MLAWCAPPCIPVTRDARVFFWVVACSCRPLCLRRRVSPAPIYLRCMRAPSDVQRAGYGGAFCKKELGTGGDYVDQEDVPPPWANMGDVQRLKQFWKEQYALATGKTLSGVNLQKHQAGALPLEPGAFSAGTAEWDVAGRDDCSCDPLDFSCIQKCTGKAMAIPKKCYEKCDSTMCHQECVHVDISFDQVSLKVCRWGACASRERPALCGCTPRCSCSHEAPCDVVWFPRWCGVFRSPKPLGAKESRRRRRRRRQRRKRWALARKVCSREKASGAARRRTRTARTRRRQPATIVRQAAFRCRGKSHASRVLQGHTCPNLQLAHAFGARRAPFRMLQGRRRAIRAMEASPPQLPARVPPRPRTVATSLLSPGYST